MDRLCNNCGKLENLCGCASGSESDQAAGSVTLPREALNELYAMAYNQGHNDTVEGGYTYILPIDMPTYFHEEVQEWIDER